MAESHKDNLPEKDRNTPGLAYDPVLFHNDEQIYFVYKKIEAIAGAVFLITTLTPDTEQVKAALRQQSLFCLNLMTGILSGQKIDVVDLQKLSSAVTQIYSLLDIAFWSGLISQMNISLIQREIKLVSKVLNDIIAKHKTSFYIDSSFFETPRPLASSPLDSKSNFKGHSKRQVVKDKVDVLESSRSQQPSPASQEKSSRREAIVNLLKEQNGLSVKDFSKVISGVSEKTIQRELLALVDEGVVKKEGERRWSTYSLAQ